MSVTLPLLGRAPNADFRVFDEDERPIWSKLRGQVMLGALRLHDLAGGESLVFSAGWSGRADSGGLVTPGDYIVRGVLLTDVPGGMPSPPHRLSIGSV